MKKIDNMNTLTDIIKNNVDLNNEELITLCRMNIRSNNVVFDYHEIQTFPELFHNILFIEFLHKEFGINETIEALYPSYDIYDITIDTLLDCMYMYPEQAQYCIMHHMLCHDLKEKLEVKCLTEELIIDFIFNVELHNYNIETKERLDYEDHFSVINEIPTFYLTEYLIRTVIRLNKDSDDLSLNSLEWYYRDNMLITLCLFDAIGYNINNFTFEDNNISIIPMLDEEECKNINNLQRLIEYNPLFIGRFYTQPESCKINALSKDGNLIEYIHNPTIDMELLALQTTYTLEVYNKCTQLQNTTDKHYINEINRLKLVNGPLYEVGC